MAPIRVLVVDDSVVVRRIVTEVLGRDPEIAVVGTAANGALALAKVPQLNPEVIVLDLEQPICASGVWRRREGFAQRVERQVMDALYGGDGRPMDVPRQPYRSPPRRFDGGTNFGMVGISREPLRVLEVVVAHLRVARKRQMAGDDRRAIVSLQFVHQP